MTSSAAIAAVDSARAAEAARIKRMQCSFRCCAEDWIIRLFAHRRESSWVMVIWARWQNSRTSRAPFRTAHLLAAWKAQEKGELLLAGAYADPVDGVALSCRCDSSVVPERFVASDPYVIGGFVTRWHIRKWTTVVGKDATDPVRP